MLLDANTQQFESFYMASSNDETPTSSSNKPGLLKVSSNCENSKQLVDRTKKNPSDQCVVLNVPTSSVNDPPLSVISVDGSQCVHYTFGSNCGLTSTYLATKKDVPNQCILATSSKGKYNLQYKYANYKVVHELIQRTPSRFVSESQCPIPSM